MWNELKIRSEGNSNFTRKITLQGEYDFFRKKDGLRTMSLSLLLTRVLSFVCVFVCLDQSNCLYDFERDNIVAKDMEHLLSVDWIKSRRMWCRTVGSYLLLPRVDSESRFTEPCICRSFRQYGKSNEQLIRLLLHLVIILWTLW